MASNPNATRAARLMRIRDLLQEEPHSVTDLAALCEVSKDTIWRDLIALQLEPLCVPLYADGDKWSVLNLRA